MEKWYSKASSAVRERYILPKDSQRNNQEDKQLSEQSLEKPPLKERLRNAKHVFLDLDGCVTPVLEGENLLKLFKLLHQLREKGVTTTICTGRPAPYVQGVARLLSLPGEAWHSAEHGAIVFQGGDGLEIRNLIPSGDTKKILEVKQLLQEYVVDEGLANFEPGKTFIAIFPRKYKNEQGEHDQIIKVKELKEIVKLILERKKVLNLCQEIADIVTSDLAVDILPKASNKLKALQECLRLNSSVKRDNGGKLRQVLYIGDSAGDWSVMKDPRIGVIGCPANADPATQELVQKQAGIISSEKTTGGVAEILEQLLQAKTS